MRRSVHFLGRRRRGAVTVELVLFAPALFLVMMGVIEFGTLFNDHLRLNHGAREGARHAAVGKPLADVRTRVRQASFSGISDTYIAIEYQTSASGTWTAVSDTPDGGNNTAPVGSLVRLRVTGYPHTMATGRFFSWLPGYSNGTLPMSAACMMRKE